MDFDATPLNVTTMLLVAFAIYVLRFLAKKQLDSNLPLLFYIALLIFINFSGRSLNPYLFAAGLSLALLLRFEFLNSALTKFVLWLEMLAIVGIAVKFAGDIFGLNLLYG
jgi:predicted membrane protein